MNEDMNSSVKRVFVVEGEENERRDEYVYVL